MQVFGWNPAGESNRISSEEANGIDGGTISL